MIHTHAKDLGKRLQLDVGDEPLAAFNPLDCILVNVNADQLHFVRERSL
jgi:hypothetical protein